MSSLLRTLHRFLSKVIVVVISVALLQKYTKNREEDTDNVYKSVCHVNNHKIGKKKK